MARALRSLFAAAAVVAVAGLSAEAPPRVVAHLETEATQAHPVFWKPCMFEKACFWRAEGSLTSQIQLGEPGPPPAAGFWDRLWPRFWP